MKAYKKLVTAAIGVLVTVSGCGTSPQTTGSATNKIINTATTTAANAMKTSAASSNTAAASANGSGFSAANSSGNGGAPVPANDLGSAPTPTYIQHPSSMTLAQEWQVANKKPWPGGVHINAINASITGKPVASALNTVAFANQNVGWVGGNGRIYATADGGQHFTRQYRGSLDIRRLDVVDTKHVFALGIKPNTSDSRVLLRTANGGQSWTTATSNSNSTPATGISQNIAHIDFVSGTFGYAIMGDTENGHSKLYRTVDGGNKWTPVSTPAAPKSMGFANQQTGWVYASNGDLYHTIDGGSRWKVAASNFPSGMGGATFHVLGPKTAWVLVAGSAGMSQESYSVLRTTDGVHWSPVLGVSTGGAGPAPAGAKNAPEGPGSSPGPLAAVNANTAIMLGECEACGAGTSSMAMTNNGGQTWSKPQTVQGVQGLPSSYAMSFPTAKNGWLIEGQRQNRVLLHTVDGGRKWTAVYISKRVSPASGFWFVNQTNGYGLGLPGDAGAVLQTTDRGKRWHKIAELPAVAQPRVSSLSSPFPLSFPTPSDGWAASGTNSVYHTLNGGRTWTEVPLPRIQGGYTVVYFRNAKVGIALNPAFAGKVEMTTDGGQHWTQKSALSLANAITGISTSGLERGLHILLHPENARWVGFNGSVAWLAGNAIGTSFLVKKGLQSQWQQIHFRRSEWPGLTSVEYVNSDDGWMMSRGGNIYFTQNGGRKWILEG